MSEINKSIKSQKDIEIEIKSYGKSASTENNFIVDEEVFPDDLNNNNYIELNKENLKTSHKDLSPEVTFLAEETLKETNVENTKLNPETETEIKDPDPDEPAKKKNTGFDERKKNKNQPL